MSTNLHQKYPEHRTFSSPILVPKGSPSDSRESPMPAARIIIADDNQMIRIGMHHLLENLPSFQIIGEAGPGNATVDLARKLKPDIIVMDFSIPEIRGQETIRQILKSYSRTEILMFLSDESEAAIHDLLAVGVRGYVLKTDAAHVIVAALEALRQHLPYFTIKVCEVVLRGYLAGSVLVHDERSILRRLTPRESEVLQLLTEGMANKEIASKLNINFKTVLAHRSNIMHKLGVDSLIDLLRFAIRAKVIKP